MYGVNEDAYSNDEQMFAVVHLMRTRIVTSPGFNGDRILGAILFENTLDRDIEGVPSSEYLWSQKNVVPFLKVDKGLAAEQDGRATDEADTRAACAAEKSQIKGCVWHQDAFGDSVCQCREHSQAR